MTKLRQTWNHLIGILNRTVFIADVELLHDLELQRARMARTLQTNLHINKIINFELNKELRKDVAANVIEYILIWTNTP